MLLATTTTSTTTTMVFELCVFPPALFCARTGRWESVGRAEEESRPTPVM
ncbi:hypothetical protein [Nostoc sp. FACHB-190]|nr:hypothetical protein [Nostoc sp. FACHB-190]